MSIRSFVPCLLAAVLLVAAPEGRAQLSEKQASKNLKSALKAEGKAFAKSAKTLGKGAAGELKALLAEANSDAFNSVDLLLLDDIMTDLRDDIVLRVGLASVAAAGVISDNFLALAGAEGVAGLDGMYPDGFYFGEGGPIDGFLAQVDTHVDKLAATLEKRLAKLAKVLEKKQGVGFTYALPLPYRRLPFTVVDNGSAPAASNELNIAFAYAYSDLSAGDDGTLCLGGNAANNLDALEVTLRGGSDDLDMDVLVGPTGESTWFVSVPDLPEGNYLVEVRVVGDPVTEYLTIGVR